MAARSQSYSTRTTANRFSEGYEKAELRKSTKAKLVYQASVYNYLATKETPDLVLTDFNPPDIDGTTLIERLALSGKRS